MSTRAGHVQFLNMTWCLGVLLVVIVSNYGVLMYVCIQYIYIYNIMLLYDSMSTCTSFSMSRYKGFAFLYQFSMLFWIVRISVQSHPEIPGESARHLTNHVPVSKTYIR